MLSDSIQRDIVIDAPPDRVWAAVTEGRTLLTVLESGFRSLEGDAAGKRRHLEANTEGWETALAGLHGYLTPLPAR